MLIFLPTTGESAINSAVAVLKKNSLTAAALFKDFV
jgi:hypothetical protein